MTKYNARRVQLDGHTFDSAAEARRYNELRLLELGGAIREIEVHPTWRIVVNGQHICRYSADFAYLDTATGARRVEDVKGVKTPVYRLKKRLMAAVHGIDVVEVAA